MLRQAMHLAVVFLVVAACGLLASCGTTPLTATSVATRPTVEAKLTGTPQQLVAFDQALRPQLGDEPVACTVNVDGNVLGCEVLQSGPASPTLKDLTYGFYGPHTSMYEKLGIALNQVVQANPSVIQASSQLTMALAHSSSPPKAPDCSQKPQPCVAAPFCTQYGGCSKQRVPCAQC